MYCKLFFRNLDRLASQLKFFTQIQDENMKKTDWERRELDHLQLELENFKDVEG